MGVDLAPSLGGRTKFSNDLFKKKFQPVVRGPAIRLEVPKQLLAFV